MEEKQNIELTTEAPAPKEKVKVIVQQKKGFFTKMNEKRKGFAESKVGKVLCGIGHVAVEGTKLAGGIYAGYKGVKWLNGKFGSGNQNGPTDI